MDLALTALEAARRKKLKITTAESCTGGMIAAALTDIPGSSDVLERGFVTYSNESKIEMLGVPQWVIAQHGAVSAQTAKAMAQGALKNARADIAVSVTGIAGPGGGSKEKPVGLVYIALAAKDFVQHEHRIFSGNRAAIRQQATRRALELILQKVERI